MKVCRLSWSFPNRNQLTHGLGPNFYYISREQAKLGAELHVVTPARLGEPSLEEVDGVKVHRVGRPYNIGSMMKLRSLHQESPVSVVHAHGTCGVTYPILRSLIKRPLVVHVHGTTLGSRRRFFNQRSHNKSHLLPHLRESLTLLRQRFFWGKADMLIAVSEAVRRELVELYHISESRIVVVPNGIDQDIFRPTEDAKALRSKLAIDNDRKIILYVGHFGPRKGLPILLDAMSLVLRSAPDAFLLAVGGIPEWLNADVSWDPLRETVRSRGLDNSVRLLGPVQHQTLPAFYSAADVFVMPSHYEAFPKVVLEAMACEAPIVATKTGGIPEIVNDGTNGLLCQPGNSSDLADKIISILDDTQRAHKMGVEGRRRVLASFTWEKTAKSIQKAYQMIV